jgi:replication factor C subunit 1
LSLNQFSATSKLFNIKELCALTFKDKLSLYFIDNDQMPLMIHENYLSSIGVNANSLPDIEKMASSAAYISFGDCVNNQIRYNQDWSLLPNLGYMGCIAPAILSSKFLPYPKFPEWFGQNSKTKKIERMIRDVKELCAHNLYSSKDSILFESIPLIFEMVFQNLAAGDPECV